MPTHVKEVLCAHITVLGHCRALCKEAMPNGSPQTNEKQAQEETEISADSQVWGPTPIIAAHSKDAYLDNAMLCSNHGDLLMGAKCPQVTTKPKFLSPGNHVKVNS